MTKLHSPLAHIKVPTEVANAQVIVREDKFLGYLNVRGNSQDKAFVKAIATQLGVALPISPCTSNTQADTSIYWLGPNEWLVLVAAHTQTQVETDLRKAMQGMHVAITDISSAQTRVNLAGGRVHEVLQKSTVYDCHEDNFPPGKVVQTTFAKTGAIICKQLDGSFDLIIRRSFADYFFLWLSDASQEYGLKMVLD